MQKWMDSVPGQTFLNYAYSWGAAVVILGTLFKLTHLPGANLMLFIGMGTEVFVFFISAFDRPFDKSTIDMTLDNHMSDEVIDEVTEAPFAEPVILPQGAAAQPAAAQPAAVVAPSAPASAPASSASASVASASSASAPASPASVSAASIMPSIPGSTIIIGGPTYSETAKPDEPKANSDNANANDSETASIKFSEPESPSPFGEGRGEAPSFGEGRGEAPSFGEGRGEAPSFGERTGGVIGAPAPAVSVATAEAMEAATTAYVERLEQLNETLQKVEQLSARLATDSEEMENLNRTLTGIARVYEMQLKSASQQITTQDSINEQTQIMADKIKELNSIYARMIEAMTTNMPKA